MKENDIIQKEAPPLYERIVADIHRRQKRRNTISLYLSFFVTLLSSSGFILACVWLYRDTTQSGLIQTASLMFTDSTVVMVYWHDFLSSLLEFLPFASLTAFLGSATALLLSLSFFSKYRHRVKYSF